MARLKLPFELEKPSSNEYVTQASEIGHNGQPLDEALSALDSISKESTQSEDEEFVASNDAGTDTYAKVGSYGVKAKDYLDLQGNNVIPTKDTLIGETPSQTNVPTSKAVKDYVDENAMVGYPFTKENAETLDEEVIFCNDSLNQTYFRIGTYGLKCKRYLDLEGNELVITKNNYSGYTINAITDSLGGYYNGKNLLYLQGCKDELGMSIGGSVIGGTAISGQGTNAFWRDTRINALDINAKIIVIQGGTNDYTLTPPLTTQDENYGFRSHGDLIATNCDTDTLYGAMNVLLSKLYYRYLNLSHGYYSDIDYSGIIKSSFSNKRLPVIVIIPSITLQDASDTGRYSKRSIIEGNRNALIAWCKYWGIDYIDAEYVGFNYMTWEEGDNTHGAMAYYDILSSKVTSLLKNLNSSMGYFSSEAKTQHQITLIDNSSSNASVKDAAREDSTVGITFDSLPSNVEVVDANSEQVAITWIDRQTNIACSFVMPDSNVTITIN